MQRAVGKMRLKAVPRIVLTLLLVGMLTLTLTFNIQRAESSEPPATKWTRTYGGDNADNAWSVVETSDGGYAVAGYTNSFGANRNDVWLVKVDSSGNMKWNKTYSGTNEDEAFSVVETVDGGYALAGYTMSFGAGGGDFWLVKVDSSGNHEWNKTYGGDNYDVGWSVVETSDGGYAIAGYTTSFGAGGTDFWLVKVDSTGGMQWNKTYGGTNNDRAYSVVETSDEGYAITGYINSFEAGSYDFWLVKTDASGNMQWNKTYGGPKNDYAWSVVETDGGGYALAGWTYSFGSGGTDFWMVKTDEDGNMQWNKTYGGTGADMAYSVVETVDGGYAVAGYTNSSGAGGDAWLVKTDSSGSQEWNKTYGGANTDYAYSVVETGDGGYAIAGSTNSFGAGWNDFWLVKVAGPTPGDKFALLALYIALASTIILAISASLAYIKYRKKQ